MAMNTNTNHEQAAAYLAYIAALAVKLRGT